MVELEGKPTTGAVNVDEWLVHLELFSSELPSNPYMSMMSFSRVPGQ